MVFPSLFFLIKCSVFLIMIQRSYGIPTKDNYVILNKSHEEFLKLEAMFNSKCIRHIFNSLDTECLILKKHLNLYLIYHY